MKVGLISGSHRKNSQSLKVARTAQARLAALGLSTATYLYDLGENPLPLWDESIWAGDPAWQERLGPISEELASCDAFIVIAPEWHGMAPAGLKNFFLMWGNGELAHKPALLIAVSASSGGAYPIAELRTSSYKNNRICYLPEHLIVRNVSSVFNLDDAENDSRSQDYISARMDYCLRMLGSYAEAFKPIRSSGNVGLETYKFGM
jgi:NAD(P)H-dependent FMN reductase